MRRRKNEGKGERSIVTTRSSYIRPWSPAELTGKEVGVASTSVSWTVDNKYYTAELQLVACEGVEVVRDGSWEGTVLLCDFSKV